jgi:CubicO group peptidase (beta-lactamase class C family)
MRLGKIASFISFIAVSAVIVFGPFGPARAADVSRKERIDAIFAEYDKPDSPGCALGVIRKGKLTYKHGYGMASLEHRVPISSKTVFRIGSVSKQFTAAAVALLAEEGTISVDDDVRKYIPEMPAYDHPITIRQLIHHTSGLRDYTGLAPMAGIDTTDHYTDEESLVLIARQRGTDFAPGDEYSYSNSGYFLLGQIVKRASGKSLREYAEEKMFGPLGMTHTHFHDSLEDVVAKRAYGYSPVEGGGFRVDMTGWEQVGDGGIFTTIEDLLLWDRNFYDNRLGRGGPALIETLETTGRLNDGKEIDYAYALVVDEYRGLRRVSHGGSWVGFRAQLTRYPEQRLSVAVLCNLGTASPGTLARRVADIYLASKFKEEEDKEAEADERTGGGPASSPERVTVRDDELRQLAGHYWSDGRNMASEIAVVDGQLVYRSGPGEEIPLIPLGSGRFIIEEADDTEIRFAGSGKGESRTMTVAYQGGEPIQFEAFEPFSPSTEELDEYAGAYYCEELDARYALDRKDHQLEFTVGHMSDQALRPVFPDVFQYQGWVTFTFHRDRSGRVHRLMLSTGRVRDLECSRRKS